MTLNEAINIDLPIKYEENKMFLQDLDRDRKSKIKVFIFKSIIETEENKMTLQASQKISTHNQMLKFAKQYNFKKLRKDHDKSNLIIQNIQEQLKGKAITVETIEKYLGVLSDFDAKQIENELTILTDSEEHKTNIIQTAKSIRSVFLNMNKIKNYQLL
eukprot:382769_1